MSICRQGDLEAVSELLRNLGSNPDIADCMSTTASMKGALNRVNEALVQIQKQVRLDEVPGILMNCVFYAFTAGLVVFCSSESKPTRRPCAEWFAQYN